MPSIVEPDLTGDMKISWDPEKPEEVEHARKHWEKLKASGHIFFRIAPEGGKGKKVSSFDGQEAGLLCEFDPNADALATRVPVGG